MNATHSFKRLWAARWIACGCVMAIAASALPASAQQSAQKSAPASSRAAPEAVVEAVQMPAWVERGADRIPLAPGMALRDQDRVRTGDNARLLLRMAEGSSVKLGEKGSLLLDTLRMQPKENVFAATMKVFEGAFRFTTNVLVKYRGRRDVEVTIAAVTAGIRGTDLWGKAAADRDIVCLIEGVIEVRRGAEAPFTMDQPLSFYIAPKDKPALPVAPVPKEQLEQWATETDIQAGRGASRRGGKWKVVLATLDTQQEALKVYDALRAAGYPADIRPDEAQGKHTYAVRLSQLPSKAEAQALADALRGKMGVAEPKVTM
jgi:hypothetical protein